MRQTRTTRNLLLKKPIAKMLARAKILFPLGYTRTILRLSPTEMQTSFTFVTKGFFTKSAAENEALVEKVRKDIFSKVSEDETRSIVVQKEEELDSLKQLLNAI